MWWKVLKNNDGFVNYSIFVSLVTAIILLIIAFPNLTGKILCGIVLIIVLYYGNKEWNKLDKESEEKCREMYQNYLNQKKQNQDS